MRRHSNRPPYARLRRRFPHIVVVILFAFYIASDAADINLSDSSSEQNSSDWEIAVTQESWIAELSKSVDQNQFHTEVVPDVSTFKINGNLPLRTLPFRTALRRIYRRLISARSPAPESPSA